jgi:hypothetical protein
MLYQDQNVQLINLEANVIRIYVNAMISISNTVAQCTILTNIYCKLTRNTNTNCSGCCCELQSPSKANVMNNCQLLHCNSATPVLLTHSKNYLKAYFSPTMPFTTNSNLCAHLIDNIGDMVAVEDPNTNTTKQRRPLFGNLK